jgi:hypothetical protein
VETIKTPRQSKKPMSAEGKARAEMLATPCPYCANPYLFQDVLTTKPAKRNIAPLPQRLGPHWRVTPRLAPDWTWEGVAGTAETRGDFWLITYLEKDFVERLEGFTAYMIGREVKTKTGVAAGPFLASTIDRLEPGAPWRYGLYFAVRIMHEQTEVAVDFHWWPTHERMVTLRGVPDEGATPQDLRLVNEALKFVRVETRGAPKVKDFEVFQAIKAIGDGATQADVAERLGISKRTLSDWLKREGKGYTWRKLRDDYLRGDIV